MSQKDAQVTGEGQSTRPSCAVLETVIHSRERDIGDFTVRRLIPHRSTRKIGPWVFFDHMGPALIAPGRGMDVRPHPHINLATVTYLFEGSIQHRDSLGNDLAIQPGEINLMVAGRGIVHSERSPKELRPGGHRIHGLQLWLALPRDDEEMAPEFIHYGREEIPGAKVGDAKVRVLIGAAFGVRSPVKTFAETLYLEAQLPKGEDLTLPPAEEKGLYVVTGKVNVDGTEVGEGAMAVFGAGKTTTVRAEVATQIAVVGGEPLEERHIFWNFVSSRPERIEQAKTDWRQGAFPTVPGDEEEFIPIPD